MANYPVNYLEQMIYVQKLQDRLNRSERLLSKVTVRSFYRPSQQQWEDAYYKQTGDAPPIPVGVKLVWYNLKNASAHLYMTTNDENGGSTSSGTVYEAIDSTTPKAPIRLLAVSSYDTGFGWANTSEDFIFGTYSTILGAGTSQTVSLRYDITKWSQRQLVAMMVFFEIRSAVASGVLHLQFIADARLSVGTFTNAVRITPQLAAIDDSNASTNANIAGRALQNLSADSVVFSSDTNERQSLAFGNATGMNDTASPTNAFTSGIMYVGNPAFSYENGVYDAPRANQNAFVSGTLVRGAFNTTNMLYNYMGYFQRTNGQPAVAGAPFFNTPASSSAGAGGTNYGRNTVMTNVHSESKAWLYGIFGVPSNRMSEYDE